jgi:hypothetical protein
MATKETYTGPVVYQDGWHYTVVPHPDGAGNGEPGHVYDVPGERLFSNGDGTYRPAVEGDKSHHEQFHQRFASIDMEDGAGATRLSESEYQVAMEAVRKEREGKS